MVLDDSGDNPPGPAAGRQGTKFLAITIAVAQLCALIRFTLLARILGPEELGLAVTIVLVSQFFDSVTESGSDRFLIQNPRGDDPRAQAMVQLVGLGRGLLVASILVALCLPISGFLGLPAIVPGLLALALAPLIGGFINMDMRRKQRGNDFRIEATAQLYAEILSLIATVVAAIISQSFLAVVAGMVVRSIVLAIVTNLMAERRYSLAYDANYARQLLHFGLPLMLNGILIFLGSQSDRILVGHWLGLAELGRYSAVLLLVYYPMGMAQRFIQAIYLPMVAKAAPQRQQSVDDLGGLTLFLTVGIAMGFALVGPLATQILFGERYAQGSFDIALIGALNAVRFLRLWPTNLALGIGSSRVVLAGNIARFMGVPMALALHMAHPSLASIIIGFTLGELLGLIIALIGFNRDDSRARMEGAGRVALCIAALLVTAVAGWSAQFGTWWLIMLSIGACLATAAGLLIIERPILARFTAMALNRIRAR